MGPTLISIVVFIALIAIIKFIFVLQEKSDAKKAQRNLDRNIENALMDSIADHSIKFLAQHSDKEKIARILSARIQDLIRLGIHPTELAKLFEKLSMSNTPMPTASSKEIEIAALAKQYILRNINSHTLEYYQAIVKNDLTPGFHKLNNSFLTKTPKDMLVLDLHLN